MNNSRPDLSSLKGAWILITLPLINQIGFHLLCPWLVEKLRFPIQGEIEISLLSTIRSDFAIGLTGVFIVLAATAIGASFWKRTMPYSLLIIAFSIISNFDPIARAFRVFQYTGNLFKINHLNMTWDYYLSHINNIHASSGSLLSQLVLALVLIATGWIISVFRFKKLPAKTEA